MFENLLASGKKGESTINGTPFIKEVPSSELIGSAALMSAIGLSKAVINETAPWLKFLLDGKTIYVSKLTRSTQLSWDEIYTARAMYGEDALVTTNLPATVPTGKAVAQDKKITIGGKQYRVRLLKVLPAGYRSLNSGYDAAALKDSEYNRLFFPITNDSRISTYTGPKIPVLYTPANFGFYTGAPNRYEWTAGANSSNPWGACRGDGNNDTLTYVSYNTYTYIGYGWRPVLELI